MDDGIPALGIGFDIDPGESFFELERLRAAMHSAEGQIVQEAARIEKATGGMVSLGGASAQIDAFANAATKAARDAKREFDQIERSGEAVVRQLGRQNDAFGKSRAELLQLRAEERALAADRVGNTDLANRIREQATSLRAKEAMAAQQAGEAERRAIETVNAELREQAQLRAALERNTGVGRVRAVDAGASFSALDAREAQAADMAAAATARLADEQRKLAEVVRGSRAAQMANADAAEAMRMSTDPLYAATARLNAEIAESTRLYYAGATAPDEYARQQTVLTQRLNGLTEAHQRNAAGAGRNAYALTQLSFQINDVATMAAMGAPPMQIFASQAGQIYQVFQTAEGGAKGFASQLGGIAVRLAPLAAGVAAVGIGLYALNQNMQDPALEEYAQSLGLTRAEMKKLGDQSVTVGDMMNGLADTLGFSFEGVGSTIKGWIVDIGNFFGTVVKGIGAATYGLFVGSYRAIVETWRQFPAMLGDIFVQAVNGAIATIERLANASIDGLNGLAQRANDMLGIDLFGQIGSVEIERLENNYAGAARAVGKAWVDSLNVAAQEGLDATDRFMADWTKSSQQAARDRLKAEADALKADRTDKKAPSDRRAESLAREAAAMEAQIRNLFRLADAYRVSGAEALIAEARVKAESAAIKKRGDIEMMVERQIRLAIAERVSEAAKSSAALREQADAQERVNLLVDAGIISAERAGDLVQDQVADQVLLAALQVAQERGYVDEIQRTTQALEDQRKARERLRMAQATAAYNAAMSSGADRLEELREELRLVGAIDLVRARALTTLRATQEARDWKPEEAAAHVKRQIEIAEQQQRLNELQADYNQSMSYTADLFGVLHDNATDAARGMSEAFGTVGTAIGDAMTVLTGYFSADERLRLQRDARIKEAGESEAAVARENHLYALRSASLRVGAFGDMADAAREFFDEESRGYRAATDAMKIFRAIEFALSVRAMAQDLGETASKIAGSAARAAASAVEAVAKAIASLPFPANLAAGAATAAALAAIGISIAGSMGGGGGNTFEPSNEGRGTVFGDPDAQSQSIKRSIDMLREVDLLMLNSSRDMAASLRSIDSQIGGVAALVVRAGNVNADMGVAEGFKPDLIGSVLGKIPLVGGLLSSLFGSKTTVTGSGLFAGPQSLGTILGGGFDASYYSEIEKTKRFLGIKTGTSRSTQYSGADAGLENQFTMILRDFNAAMIAAAGPLGIATSDITQRLNGMVVSIGKIDLKGLTGEQIQEKLTAVFGAAADNMARTAFPGFERFQRVGEGLFETVVRVSSTVETVTASLDRLGVTASALGIDAQIALADQFESLGALSSATQSFFERFYTAQEQAAAQMAQFDKVFASLGVTMPSTLAGFRALVESQDLTTDAGRKTYAMLLQLAPAFADLQGAMNGARSAADILAERYDLERKLLELQGDTAKLRELDLAKLDESNRALQLQIWALQDAQEAARQADELRKAWGSVGDSIEDEINRIRGLNTPGGDGTFASLMGEFNAMTAAARGGDQDAAKQLPGLSQALLRVAGLTATSRQELDRVQAQTAASLEQTLRLVAAFGGGAAPSTGGSVDALIARVEHSAGTAVIRPDLANDGLTGEVVSLREEIAAMRRDNNAGHAATASNTAGIKRKLDDVTAAGGGEAIAVTGVAA